MEMLATVSELELPYIAMHMRGTSQSMQSLTNYTDVAAEVADYLLARAAEAERRGVARNNIILDPGFGFAKTVEQNYELLAGLKALRALGYPLLIGVSRKSMIYKVLDTTPQNALAGTTALNWEAINRGATILRVHDVEPAVQIVKIFREYTDDKGFGDL